MWSRGGVSGTLCLAMPGMGGRKATNFKLGHVIQNQVPPV